MKKTLRTGIAISALLATATVAVSAPARTGDGIVNVYSARKQELIEPLLHIFEEQTGISFNLVTGNADELLTRLKLEADATPADVFITVDAGRLHRAKEASVLRQIGDEALREAVPPHLQDKDGYWIGLSKRARVIVYSVERVSEGSLTTYEGLAGPEWNGRICIRSSSNIYNQSLVASMIASDGQEATEAWAAGIVSNMARPPAGGDTDQIKAVSAGECDVAVVNTYYFGRLAGSDDPDNNQIVEKLKIHWPNQADRGTHVNVSGAGITMHAPNPDNALTLLRFLVSPEAQQWYAAVNFEYPTVTESPLSPVLVSFGDFQEDDLNLSLLGSNNRKAVELMDRAGWR